MRPICTSTVWLRQADADHWLARAVIQQAIGLLIPKEDHGYRQLARRISDTIAARGMNISSSRTTTAATTDSTTDKFC